MDDSYSTCLILEAIQDKRTSLKELKAQLYEHETQVATQTSWLKLVALKYHVKKPMDKKLCEVSERHERKYTS